MKRYGLSNYFYKENFINFYIKWKKKNFNYIKYVIVLHDIN